MSRPDERDLLPPDLELPSRLEPPAALEERVVSALRQRGLVRPAPRRPRVPWLLAACLLAALGGWWGRSLVETSTPPRAAGDHYLLLLTEPRPLATDKPMPELVAEYAAWGAELAEEGKIIAAARLRPGGEHLKPPASPTGEEIAQVTGYFILIAPDLETARAIAATCPHLAYDGEISVRRLYGDTSPPRR
ncbi:MAG: YciI family protein [Acidobacteriota bacterium]